MTAVKKIQQEMDNLKEMIDSVNMLQDLHETAVAEDDRWTARLVLEELELINEKLAQIEDELLVRFRFSKTNLNIIRYHKKR